MVSGVDSPVGQQNPLIEASTNVALINQARQGAILNTSQLVVGKQFQAEVVSSLEDGTYIVKVADVAARMQLPNSPQIGDKLSLTLISTSPRATFLLGAPDSEEAAPSNPTTTSATLGATVKQLVDDFNQTVGAKTGGSTPTGLYLQGSSAVAPTTEADTEPRLIVVNTGTPDSAPANLSNVGKLVNQLIQSTPQEAAVVNVSKVPLLTTPDVNVNTMAKALQSGVANSGSFYESHLLQWAEGSLDVNELMKEPQASFPATAPTAAQNNTEQGANTNPSQAMGQNNPVITSNGLLATMATAQTSNAPASASTTSMSTSSSANIALPKEATPLIQQQLQTLEQQRFVWQGELWPGQTMQWEISRDRQDQQQSNPQDKTWQSAVRFELPQLGNVSAQLQLTGNHLRMTVQAPDAATAQLMQIHAGELSGALENNGTKLDSLLIKTKAVGNTQ